MEKIRAVAPVWLQMTTSFIQVFDDLPTPRAIAAEYLSDAELDLATITGVVVALMRYSSVTSATCDISVDRPDGEFPDRCFAAQHHRVGAVEDGVGDVAHLGPRRRGLLDHRLQHLRRDDHRLAGGLASADQVLLDDRHLGHVHLHAQIAAGDHQAIGGFDDRVDLVERLGLFDFGDQLDIRCGFADVRAEGCKSSAVRTNERAR